MKRQTFDDPGYAYYLTFTCYRRQQLLTDDQTKTWLPGAPPNRVGEKVLAERNSGDKLPVFARWVRYHVDL